MRFVLLPNDNYKRCYRARQFVDDIEIFQVLDCLPDKNAFMWSGQYGTCTLIFEPLVWICILKSLSQLNLLIGQANTLFRFLWSSSILILRHSFSLGLMSRLKSSFWRILSGALSPSLSSPDSSNCSKEFKFAKVGLFFEY